MLDLMSWPASISLIDSNRAYASRVQRITSWSSRNQAPATDLSQARSDPARKADLTSIGSRKEHRHSPRWQNYARYCPLGEVPPGVSHERTIFNAAITSFAHPKSRLSSMFSFTSWSFDIRSVDISLTWLPLAPPDP